LNFNFCHNVSHKVISLDFKKLHTSFVFGVQQGRFFKPLGQIRIFFSVFVFVMGKGEPNIF